MKKLDATECGRDRRPSPTPLLLPEVMCVLAASATVSRDKLDKFLKKDSLLEFPKEGTIEGEMTEKKGNWV